MKAMEKCERENGSSKNFIQSCHRKKKRIAMKICIGLLFLMKFIVFIMSKKKTHRFVNETGTKSNNVDK